MRDTGGHGGSSVAEIRVPLILVGDKCVPAQDFHRQIDIAPTLSILLGQPIPASSIGALIPEMMSGLTPERQLFAYHYNGNRLLSKLLSGIEAEGVQNGEMHKHFQNAIREHERFLSSPNDKSLHESQVLFKNARSLYISSTREMSERLAKSYVTYDDYSISIGLIILITVRRKAPLRKRALIT